MKYFEKYSPVRFMGSNLGGGVNYCTTESTVLFNFNDLLELLNIKDKKLRRRWESKLEDCDIETGIPTNRGVDGECKESYITLEAITMLMSVYADGVIEDIERKNSVDYTIADILDEVEKHDKFGKEPGQLSAQYALDALKLNSKIAKGSNDALVNILKLNNSIRENYHKPWFDTEYEINLFEELERYGDCLDDIYNAINSIDFYVPENKIEDDGYSLLIDDYDPDTIDDEE